MTKQRPFMIKFEEDADMKLGKGIKTPNLT